MAKRIIKLIVMGGLLSACTATPPTRFYVLEPQFDVPAVSADDQVKKLIIGIGPISIPALLERKQLVTRDADNNLQIAELQQWAAPLKDNIAEVLAQNLTALQPSQIIRAYPWNAYGSIDYQIIVQISRFDAKPEQSANLEANWAIMDQKSHSVVSNGFSKIQAKPENATTTGNVKALNNTLATLSQELAKALSKLK
ncbi:MAG: PqiC family protein [Methylococcaceae bacterium]|nr:PqiC family protein [Methylococcaceae bacterium]